MPQPLGAEVATVWGWFGTNAAELLTALATVLAVVVALHVAQKGAIESRAAARRAERQATALRVVEWIGAVSYAIDRHILQRHVADPAMQQPADDAWTNDVTSIERQRESLEVEVRITFGPATPLAASIAEVHACLLRLHGELLAWRDEVRVLESREYKASGWIRYVRTDEQIAVLARQAFATMVQKPYESSFPPRRRKLERVLRDEIERPQSEGLSHHKANWRQRSKSWRLLVRIGRWMGSALSRGFGRLSRLRLRVSQLFDRASSAS